MSKELNKAESLELLDSAVDLRGRELALRGLCKIAEDALGNARLDLSVAESAKPKELENVEEAITRVKNNRVSAEGLASEIAPDPTKEPWWEEYNKLKNEKITEPFANPLVSFFGVGIVSALMFCIPYVSLNVLVCWIFGLFSSFWTVFGITTGVCSVLWGLWAAISLPKEKLEYSRKMELLRKGREAVEAYEGSLSDRDKLDALSNDTENLLNYISLASDSVAEIEYLEPFIRMLKGRLEAIELKRERFFRRCELFANGNRDYESLVNIRNYIKNDVADNIPDAIGICREKLGERNDEADTALMDKLDTFSKLGDSLGIALRQVADNLGELRDELFTTLKSLAENRRSNEDKEDGTLADSLTEKYASETVTLYDGLYTRFCEE